MTRCAAESGLIVKRKLARDPRTRYLRFLPRNPDPARPPLVCVHGISRHARDHLEAFVPWAEHTGTELIAPLYDRRRYRGYQRLRSSNRRLHAAAALDAILAETVGDRPCLLYGFSGGAQFAHRYAMVRPGRVAALALAAAGWYTFPTRAASFPYGIAPGRLPRSLSIDYAAFLGVPKCVLVGDRDVERDESLRSNRRLDSEQGDNRLARATAWVEAMNREARRLPGRPACEFVILPGMGHDWARCYASGGLGRRVTDFFEALQPQAPDKADTPYPTLETRVAAAVPGNPLD